MLRWDLEAARAAWIERAEDEAGRRIRSDTNFLVYRDDSGRVLDFHSFRHTFVSRIAGAGVHPKQAQDLARHSDINLTLTRYSHTVLGDQAEAIESLPDLSPSKPDREQLRATGTPDTDRVRDSLPTSLPRDLPRRAVPPPIPIASRCTVRKEGRQSGSHVSSGKPRTYGAPLHRVAPYYTDGENEPPVGFEPTTCGLQNRCSAN